MRGVDGRTRCSLARSVCVLLISLFFSFPGFINPHFSLAITLAVCVHNTKKKKKNTITHTPHHTSSSLWRHHQHYTALHCTFHMLSPPHHTDQHSFIHSFVRSFMFVIPPPSCMLRSLSLCLFGIRFFGCDFFHSSLALSHRTPFPALRSSLCPFPLSRCNCSASSCVSVSFRRVWLDLSAAALS